MIFTPKPSEPSPLIPALVYPAVITVLASWLAYEAGYWFACLVDKPEPSYHGYALAALVGTIVITVGAYPWNVALVSHYCPKSVTQTDPRPIRVELEEDHGHRADWYDLPVTPGEASRIVQRGYALTLNAPGLQNSRLKRLREMLVQHGLASEDHRGRVTLNVRGRMILRRIANE